MKSGTYEAIGPYFQSNPYNLPCDKLVRHGADVIRDCPRTFEGLCDYLAAHNIDGTNWAESLGFVPPKQPTY